jgi:hypothetical protein
MTAFLTFWCSFLGSAICGVLACAGALFSKYRHRWWLIASAISILVGGWVARDVTRDGAWLSLEGFDFIVLTPWLMGIVALFRWVILPSRNTRELGIPDRL